MKQTAPKHLRDTKYGPRGALSIFKAKPVAKPSAKPAAKPIKKKAAEPMFGVKGFAHAEERNAVLAEPKACVCGKAFKTLNTYSSHVSRGCSAAAGK